MFATLSPPLESCSAARGPSVLLVEDEHASRRALSTLLRIAGYEIRAAESAEDALELLASPDEGSPTIALVDLNLPGMDGLELITRLRQRDATVFAILITAKDSPSLQEKIQQIHVGYLRKPINFEHLLHLIQQHFPN